MALLHSAFGPDTDIDPNTDYSEIGYHLLLA